MHLLVDCGYLIRMNCFEWSTEGKKLEHFFLLNKSVFFFLLLFRIFRVFTEHILRILDHRIAHFL